MEMKQAVSRLLGKEALSFNDEVAKLYERPGPIGQSSPPP
jgi:hypothetical protein